MLKRLFTTILAVVAIAGFAQVATAQYMYLDSNGDGVHTAADVMNANGAPTTVDVWVDTDNNRDGSAAVCNSSDADLTFNSYVVNLRAQNGTVTYTNFINRQTTMTFNFVEVNTGDGQYKNGFGQQTPLAPGTYRMCTITVTGTGGTPSLLITDINTNSPDFTSFGSQCEGNDFDNTYKLGSDWSDADGLGAAAGQNAPPVLDTITDKTVNEGTLHSFTATASDPDAGTTLTFTLGAGAPAGASISTGGAFTWTPTEAQGPGF